MNDNDIIKALTHCVNSDCSTCPCDALNCSEKIPMAFAIDLINRQKAEIDRLKKELIEQQIKNNLLYETAKEIRTEAIKEFADRLKGEFEGLAVCTVNSVANKISNLVKEMTEDKS